MKVLALDTSTEWLSVALYADGEWSQVEQLAGQKHAELILPTVDQLLVDGGVQLADLAGIVYGEGPGSFTGLRIGCGVVQGLAYGARLPVYGVPTLLAMAEGSGHDRVYACLDARAGEVYCAAYQRIDSGWEVALPVTLCKPGAVPAPATTGWHGVGNGFTAYDGAAAQNLASYLSVVDANIMPSAVAMLRLAMPQLQAGAGRPAQDCAPVYVRDKVAMTVEERRKA